MKFAIYHKQRRVTYFNGAVWMIARDSYPHTTYTPETGQVTRQGHTMEIVAYQGTGDIWPPVGYAYRRYNLPDTEPARDFPG